mmetsp:Transcript_566/g.422  ORF Transcript_566/g.422 Transcript_566/m.422 type:complete len:97 (+) Transcript_566:43-333(+)
MHVLAGMGHPLREELVVQARRFLRHDEVRGAPWAEQRAFLTNRGLSEAEIAAAQERVQLGAHQVAAPASAPPSEAAPARDRSTELDTARAKLSYLF